MVDVQVILSLCSSKGFEGHVSCLENKKKKPSLPCECLLTPSMVYVLFSTALFIVDGYYDVYVWEGWMPEEDDDVRTGSGRQRWDRDRRLAMETALNYAKGLLSTSLLVYLFTFEFFVKTSMSFEGNVSFDRV